jgi:hypothetical protein
VLDHVGEHEQHRDVHQHPDGADEEEPRLTEHGGEVHLHADRRDEDVEEDRPDARSTDAFKGARFR